MASRLGRAKGVWSGQVARVSTHRPGTGPSHQAEPDPWAMIMKRDYDSRARPRDGCATGRGLDEAKVHSEEARAGGVRDVVWIVAGLGLLVGGIVCVVLVLHRTSSASGEVAPEAAVRRGKAAIHSPTSRPATMPAPSGSDGPTVVHVRAVEGEHDFGYVEPASKHRVTFVVANANDSPLKIRKVRSECNYCIKIAGYPKTIAPGGGGRFVIDFVAPKKSTAYASRVVLATDDPNRSIIALKIKADVGRALVVSPGVVNLGKLAVGQEGKGEVTLINRGKKAFRPIYSTSSSPGCSARIPRASVAPGGKLSIPLVAKAEGGVGKKKCVVHIQTNNPNQPRLTVRIEYEVVPQNSAPRAEKRAKGEKP